MPDKNKDFETWDSDYDIPDDPRPEDIEIREFSDVEDLQNEIMHKEDMRNYLQGLREKALSLRRKQNDYWDNYGDSYKLEELVEFILENKEDITGVVKNAFWLVKDTGINWEYRFDFYYDTLLEFIKRSQYAISSYDSGIKKLKEKLKGMSK